MSNCYRVLCMIHAEGQRVDISAGQTPKAFHFSQSLKDGRTWSVNNFLCLSSLWGPVTHHHLLLPLQLHFGTDWLHRPQFLDPTQYLPLKMGFSNSVPNFCLSLIVYFLLLKQHLHFLQNNIKWVRIFICAYCGYPTFPLLHGSEWYVADAICCDKMCVQC